MINNIPLEHEVSNKLRKAKIAFAHYHTYPFNRRGLGGNGFGVESDRKHEHRSVFVHGHHASEWPGASGRRRHSRRDRD